MSDKNLNKEALKYHSEGKAGKVDVNTTKSCSTEYDLSLAYSPGVAAPCLEIAKNPAKAYEYTTKGNLVGVVTDGTAVLGLGNIGALAGKPVMEGKGVLFKQFANIDVFDIELNSENTEAFISTVKAMEPTFGGINLEDIAAPQCFEIEERLKKEMNIPVFHDDQHGTAIIAAAALINSCHITKKKLSKIKVVFNGAGAASISCARLFFSLGVPKKNIIMCDSRGPIYKGRTDGMNKYKKEFINDTKARTLKDALKGADVFCGLSVAGALTKDMLKGMGKKPIVFAMANPNPEILPSDAKSVRDDLIIATGRSDFPNQVNNVLGFPYIFRGALDVQASQITEEMKIAAVKAIAQLAREDVPENVSEAYDNKNFSFGPDYIIPKPFDNRVLTYVAPAVAQAAMDCGVARKKIKDLEKYREHLEGFQGFSRSFIRTNINNIKASLKKTKSKPPTLIFPEGRSLRVLKAINSIHREKIMHPIVLGNKEKIQELIKEHELENLKDLEIYHPTNHPKYQAYADELYEMRHRKGVMKSEAQRLMRNSYYFSSMAVHKGLADGLISGAVQNYADCVRPILEIIGSGPEKVAAGLNFMLFKDRILLMADTTVHINPNAEELATIAIYASQIAKFFKIKPRVAMLGFSNFTGKGESASKMQQACDIARKKMPSLIIDGEMQADTALNPEISERIFNFNKVKEGANILIFPNLEAGNIGYKMVQQLTEAEVIGPFLMGVNKPANVLQRTCKVDDIMNSIVLTALQTQHYKRRKK